MEGDVSDSDVPASDQPGPSSAGHPTSVSDGSASDQPGPSSAYNLKKKLKIPPNNLVV